MAMTLPERDPWHLDCTVPLYLAELPCWALTLTTLSLVIGQARVVPALLGTVC